MPRKSPEEYIHEDIKILKKRLENLDSEYKQRLEDLKALPALIEEQKRFNIGIIDSQQKTILTANERIEKLEDREKILCESISESEKKLKETHDKHAEISKRYMVDLMDKQRNIEAIYKQEQDLILRRTIAEDALNKITSIRIETDIDNENIQGEILSKKSEIDSINEDILVLISQRDSTDEEIRAGRELLLKNEDEKKELAVRLHDVRVLELRLKPEFQNLLQSYLENKHG